MRLFGSIKFIPSRGCHGLMGHELKPNDNNVIMPQDWQIEGYSWDRHIFRMADDVADIYGYPYIVGWLCRHIEPHADELSQIYFYKWSTRSELVLMFGDDRGVDYSIRCPNQLLNIGQWWEVNQQKWARRYHSAEPPPERNVPDNFKTIGELLRSIQEKVSGYDNAKGSEG